MLASAPGRSLRTRLGRGLIALLSLGIATLWAVPVVWALVASLRPANEPLGRGDVWFAFPLTLDNYARAPGRWPVRSLLCQHGRHRAHDPGCAVGHHHPGRLRLRPLRLCGQAGVLLLHPAPVDDPHHRVAVAQLRHHPHAGPLRPRLAIAIPYFGSAFGTFLMRQIFLEVPKDLVDAGVMDGCSWWQLLRNVYLPPAVPTSSPSGSRRWRGTGTNFCGR
ncbi:MAG: ABC transporter permease subunit [Caldilineaceae bacterium]